MEKKRNQIAVKKVEKINEHASYMGEVGGSDIVYFPSQIDSKNNDDEIILGVLQPPRFFYILILVSSKVEH